MTLSFRINNEPEEIEIRDCGLLPIMVRVGTFPHSSRIWLSI